MIWKMIKLSKMAQPVPNIAPGSFLSIPPNPGATVPLQPVTPSEQRPSPLSEKKSSPLIFVVILLLILAVGVGIGGYYLGGKTSKEPAMEGTKAEATLLPGYAKAENLTKSYPELISRTRVQLVYNGELTETEPGKSWILDKDGKKVTITHEGSEPVRYLRSVQGQNNQEPIDASEVKAGDNVSIASLIDPESGQVSIGSVIVNVTNSPTPSPTPEESALP